MPFRHFLPPALFVSAAAISVFPGLVPQRSCARSHPLLSAESSFEAKLRHFAPAADLPTVRGELSKLQNKLQAAIDEQDFAAAAMIRDDIAELRSKDPAVMSSVLKEQMQQAVEKEDYEHASALRDQMLVLRRFLPQYQLAGLWKGARSDLRALLSSLLFKPLCSPPFLCLPQCGLMWTDSCEANQCLGNT